MKKPFLVMAGGWLSRKPQSTPFLLMTIIYMYIHSSYLKHWPETDVCVERVVRQLVLSYVTNSIDFRSL